MNIRLFTISDSGCIITLITFCAKEKYKIKMFKKKIKPKLQGFWEKKLNISYAVELEQYKKLCGISYDRKLLLKKYPFTQDLLMYDIWKTNIIDSIINLSGYDLKEYSRFLNQKIRENDTIFSLSQTLLIPFMIYIVGLTIDIVIISYIKKCLASGDIISALVGVILLIISLVYIFSKFISIKEESIRKYFYQDIKNIVDEKIEDMKK